MTPRKPHGWELEEFERYRSLLDKGFRLDAHQLRHFLVLEQFICAWLQRAEQREAA
jgi:hypothetical protein